MALKFLRIMMLAGLVLGYASQIPARAADVSAWATNAGEAQMVVKRLETIDVFRPFQVTRLAVPAPTLVVGDGFFRLPFAEQERVLALFDLAYGITPRRSGTLFLEHPDTGKVIGLYTGRGIQWY